MGRHSSPEQAPFLGSLLGWVLPWVLVAAVAIVAVAVGVSALGQQTLDAGPAPDRGGAPPGPSPDPSPRPTEDASPSPSPRKQQTGGREERDRDGGRERPALITEGVSVQVLNGTASAGADDAVIRRLARLGYEVVAVVTAAHLYDDTTVFWSSSRSRRAARALARRFGWRSLPKPANLSPGVDVHVVVGADEA
jgi:hypothetical protein